jgi:hypothetical protein
MTEKEEKAAYNQIAELIVGPILNIVDIAIGAKPDFIEKMEEALKGMEEAEGMAAAFPFPETMEKSKEMRCQNDTFECILDLCKSRLRFKELREKQAKGTAGNQVLKHLGF